MPCEILDLKCLFQNEIIGSPLLAIIVFAVAYFIVASKLRLGFDTTVALSVPVILLISLAFGGFATLYAFLGILAGFMIAWLVGKIMN